MKLELKNIKTSDEIYNYLTENNFHPNFTFLKKIYYSFARPLLPLFTRHFLQNYYNREIKFHENFIWPELVNILKSDKNIWSNFIENLYPGGFQTAIILTHDVETQKGFNFIPKIIELEEKYGFKSSWNIVPYKYKIDDTLIRYTRENGHEIGIHGYNHDGKLYYSKKIFDYRSKYINEAIERYGAVGFRSPQVHRNLEWLQQLNILYDASCFDYDPFQPFPGGTGSIWPFIAGKFVELPYTLPQDHVLFYILKQKNISIWENKINWLVKNHGMILGLIHPDYLIEKNNLKLYEELLVYLSGVKNSWRCLPKEIALYFVKH